MNSCSRKTSLLLAVAVLYGGGGSRAATAQSRDVGWAMYNMSYEGIRSSPLNEINPKNVQNLRSVCRVKLGEEGTLMASPVVIGDTLFMTTAHSTVALDATNCKLIWRFVDAATPADVYAVNRGVAYLDGRLFRGTPDGRLVALSSDSGRVLWNVKAGDPAKGEFTASAPIAWQGTVFMGLAGSDWGIRGRVMAFDAKTGREKWRFWTVPTGNEPGAETWHIPESVTHGGGGTWSSYTLDTLTQELFVPVGNPSPDFTPASRPGDNLFTNSVVVLDALSGALKWWYQVSPADGFDYDLAAAPVLYSAKSGAARVLIASKDGHLYAVERGTHKLTFKTPITTVSRAGPVPTADGVHACPGPLGGVEWNGPAFDATSGTLYVGAVDFCATYLAGQQELVAGGMYFGTRTSQASDSARGWLTAVDAESGTPRWQFHAPTPIVAGVTHTAGGLVLTGDLKGNFYAFDAATGKVAYQTNLGGAVAGGVMTYAVRGRQYIAASAGNVGRATFGVLGSPSLVVMALGPPARAGRRAGAQVAEIALPPISTGTALSHGELGGAEQERANGLRVYQVCAACHGARGEGGVGANLQTSTLGLGGIIAYVKAPTGSMPKLYPSPLSDADVASVASYVMTLRKP